jgi:hypothetical protein
MPPRCRPTTSPAALWPPAVPVHSPTVRREDPDRLILGDRLHCGPMGTRLQ